jgi:geranylgeranyl diphosphate synthase type I
MPAPIVDAVSRALTEFLALQTEIVAAIDPDLGELTGTLGEFTAGGKRLRPAFCHQGWLGAGGDPTMLDPAGRPTPVVRACAALDLLHASALIHDDLMDDSDTRRGRPSTHVHYARRHGERGLTGDAIRFGAGAAILLGDLSQAWADELLRTCGLAADRVLEGLRCFDIMRTEVITGQYLDVLAQTDPGTTLARALRVVQFKSARYSVMRPLELGGVLAGADEALLRRYREIGEPIGEAFQLRDDVLGVFGDPAVTGKPAGDDVREGKRTVLVLLARQAADVAQLAVLDHWLGNAAMTDDGADAVRTVMIDTGALGRVEAMITERTEQALSVLAATRLAGDGVGASLAALAVAATARSV